MSQNFAGQAYTPDMQFWYSFVSVFLPFYIFAQAKSMVVNERKIDGSSFVPGIAFGTGMIPVIAAASSYLIPLTGYSQDALSGLSPDESFAFLLVYAFATPFFEEVVYRGIVLTYFRKFGDRFALVMQAVLFSLAHRNVTQSFSTFFLGLVLGYITLTSGSIWAGLFVHILNNMLALYGGIPVPFAATAVGLLGLWYLSRHVTFTKYKTSGFSVLGSIGTLAVCLDELIGEIKLCVIR